MHTKTQRHIHAERIVILIWSKANIKHKPYQTNAEDFHYCYCTLFSIVILPQPECRPNFPPCISVTFPFHRVFCSINGGNKNNIRNSNIFFRQLPGRLRLNKQTYLKNMAIFFGMVSELHYLKKHESAKHIWNTTNLACVITSFFIDLAPVFVWDEMAENNLFHLRDRNIIEVYNTLLIHNIT